MMPDECAIRPMDNPVVPNFGETWQQRANECRATAKRLRTFEARKRLLSAAEDFDRMAIGAKAETDDWPKVTR